MRWDAFTALIASAFHFESDGITTRQSTAGLDLIEYEIDSV